jgi:hypothetical protein
VKILQSCSKAHAYHIYLYLHSVDFLYAIASMPLPTLCYCLLHVTFSLPTLWCCHSSWQHYNSTALLIANMGEVVNVVVTFAVIIFIICWVTLSSTFSFCHFPLLSFSLGTWGGGSITEQADACALCFKQKKVKPEMACLLLGFLINSADFWSTGRNAFPALLFPVSPFFSSDESAEVAVVKTAIIQHIKLNSKIMLSILCD